MKIKLYDLAVAFFLVVGLAVITPLSVYASTKEDYSKFHKFIYYPVQVIGFLMTGGVSLVISLVQHKDDQMKAEVDASGN